MTPVVLPSHAAAVSPQADVINLAADRRSVVINVADVAPFGAVTGVIAPDGWLLTGDAGQLTVTAPAGVAPGLYDVPLTLDGNPAYSVTRINRAHVAQRALVTQAVAQVRVIDAAIPEVRVAYIGGGNDRVGMWLDRLGVGVTDVSDVTLSDAILARYDTPCDRDLRGEIPCRSR